MQLIAHDERLSAVSLIRIGDVKDLLHECRVDLIEAKKE
jgi:hypothetical protein